MAEESSSTGPIIVAIIGVVGTITAAAIANWDKLSSARGADRARVAQSSHDQAPSGPTSAEAEPAAKDIGMDAAAPINLGGKWVDAAGYEYMFDPGDGFQFKRYKNGEQVGWGAGSVTGHAFTYVDRGADFGDCRGTVSADLQEMNSLCTVGTNQFRLKLTRQTTVAL